MEKQTLKIISQLFSIHSFAPEETVPIRVFNADIYFISKTLDELSIVVPEDITLNSLDSEPGWQALEVLGPLDFTMTGILANISGVLAQQKISIFAISTFDTDYILVKENTMQAAITALRNDGYTVVS
jgi:hypothetical protein